MVLLGNMHILIDSRELELGSLGRDDPLIIFLIKSRCPRVTQLLFSLLGTLIALNDDVVLSKVGHKVVHFVSAWVRVLVLSAACTAANWITLGANSQVSGRSSQLLSELIIESTIIISNISLGTG